MLRVERHRKIRAGSRERPRGGDGAVSAVYHGDMARGWDVHKDPGTVGLKHERLRMALKRDLSDLPIIGRSENGEPPTFGADIQQAGGSVVPNVVGIVPT